MSRGLFNALTALTVLWMSFVPQRSVLLNLALRGELLRSRAHQGDFRPQDVCLQKGLWTSKLLGFLCIDLNPPFHIPSALRHWPKVSTVPVSLQDCELNKPFFLIRILPSTSFYSNRKHISAEPSTAFGTKCLENNTGMQMSLSRQLDQASVYSRGMSSLASERAFSCYCQVRKPDGIFLFCGNSPSMQKKCRLNCVWLAVLSWHLLLLFQPLHF